MKNNRKNRKKIKMNWRNKYGRKLEPSAARKKLPSYFGKSLIWHLFNPRELNKRSEILAKGFGITVESFKKVRESFDEIMRPNLLDFPDLKTFDVRELFVTDYIRKVRLSVINSPGLFELLNNQP